MRPGKGDLWDPANQPGSRCLPGLLPVGGGAAAPVPGDLGHYVLQDRRIAAAW